MPCLVPSIINRNNIPQKLNDGTILKAKNFSILTNLSGFGKYFEHKNSIKKKSFVLHFFYSQPLIF